MMIKLSVKTAFNSIYHEHDVVMYCSQLNCTVYTSNKSRLFHEFAILWTYPLQYGKLFLDSVTA